MTASASRCAVEWRSTDERVGVLRVARREELDGLAVLEREAQVARRAVHAREHGLLGELRPDRARGVEAGRAVGELELGGVGKDDLHREVRIDRPRGYLSRDAYRHLGRRRSCTAPPPRRAARTPCDRRDWENHPAHFWLVLGAALVATALGFSVTTAARRRRDARLFLISLAFVASAAFLGLHALATPGVLLGPNAGFELATPVGLLLAALFAAAASLELRSDRADAVLRFGTRRCSVALGALVVVWAAVSLAELPPLDDPLAAEQLDGWQLILAAVGVALFGIAAFGFLRLHRRRQERFVLAFALAFVLLAEAMVVIAWARNWQVSWWEWHVLMLGVVPAHRVRRAGRVARGALQRALPRRDARGRARGERRLRRPRRLHGVHASGTPPTRSRRCSTRTSGGSSR